MEKVTFMTMDTILSLQFLISHFNLWRKVSRIIWFHLLLYFHFNTYWLIICSGNTSRSILVGKWHWRFILLSVLSFELNIMLFLCLWLTFCVKSSFNFLEKCNIFSHFLSVASYIFQSILCEDNCLSMCLSLISETFLRLYFFCSFNKTYILLLFFASFLFYHLEKLNIFNDDDVL